MQIVIDIPIDTHYHTKKRNVSESDIKIILEAISKSIPLLKGHGKLVDADELLTSERPKGIADDVWKESHIYKLLSNAPTIIEADNYRSR